MNKKKTMGIMTVMGLGVAVLAGCSGDTTKEVVKLTPEEEEKFVTEFGEKVISAESSTAIIEEIDANIEKLSKDEASNMVDGLLYVLHQQYNSMNTKIAGLQENFVALESKEIDINSLTDIEKVEDLTTKAFLTEAITNKFIVQKVGASYYARPDIKWVLDTYSKYMNEDLLAMTEFSLAENEKPFYNESANAFDLDLVVSRILKIEENIKKFPESFYVDSMVNSKNYYYQVYFGTNNEFLVDENDVVLDAVLESYKKTVAEKPESQLGQDTALVLSKLAESKNVVTDDLYVYLLELTGTVTEDVAEEAVITEEKANEIVEDAKVEAEASKSESTK